MTCSKQELLLRLFNYASSYLHLLLNHASTSLLHLLLLFLFSLAIFTLTFSTFTGRFPLIQRDRQYDEYVFSEDDDEEEETQEEGYCHHAEKVRDHEAAADSILIHGRENLSYEEPQKNKHCSYSEDFTTPRESLNNEQDSEEEEEEEEDQEFIGRNADDAISNSVSVARRPITSTITMNTYKSDGRVCVGRQIKNKKVQEANFTRDDRFFIFDPTHHQFHNKKLSVQDKHDDDDDDDGDSCIDDSSSAPSRVSSEWRKDSETEEALSSSSRRSCPKKWESSYTLFQKYDEEMSLLDRITAQKLQETEYLRSMEASPTSISKRIASSVKKKAGDVGHLNNPYAELEAAYVAQICLTWEALNWNYKNFESKHHQCRHEADRGCPASTAHQYQQFQVLLQRYIENEPYEHGRRPEIYARMRLLAPKLLLVPQCPDWEEDEKNGGLESRISSESFLKIMEDGIRTFMKFLKADKEKPCQMVAAYFWRKRILMVDPTLLRLIKKVNQKKRKKVKDVGARKRKVVIKGEEEEEMDVLMAMIDLKVVSRVLRMKELSEAQLHWCEHKMSKVRIVSGKLQTDYSTPLFFPSSL